MFNVKICCVVEFAHVAQINLMHHNINLHTDFHIHFIQLIVVSQHISLINQQTTCFQRILTIHDAVYLKQNSFIELN